MERFKLDHVHDGGMKDKIYHLRSRGMEKLESWKPVAQRRIADARDTVKGQLGRLQHEVRSHPAKWAGIAAGAGLGLGLIGRIIRKRMRSGEVPTVVILEAC